MTVLTGTLAAGKTDPMAEAVGVIMAVAVTGTEATMVAATITADPATAGV